MAATWFAQSASTSITTAGELLNGHNASGSARVMRVYRIVLQNASTSAVTSIVTGINLKRQTTTPTGGTTITPVACDTNSSALPSEITWRTGGTPGTKTDLFRQTLWLGEEVSGGSCRWQEWTVLIPFSLIWESGYYENDTQPITCRAAQGVSLAFDTTQTSGTVFTSAVFTDEAT